MVKRPTPRKPRIRGDYGNVGVKGRKTGIELKDSGIREADGLEPVPSFSSPAKQLILPNGASNVHDEDATTFSIQHETYTADETMEIERSDAQPEVREVIRSTKHSIARRSLPRSVSPRKTDIRGSARKSLGLHHEPSPMVSPSRNANQLPRAFSNVATSTPPVGQPINRRLKYASVQSQKTTPDAKQHRPKISSVEKARRPGPFDLSILSDDEDQNGDDEVIDPSSILMPDAEDPGASAMDENGDASGIGDGEEQDATMVEKNDQMRRPTSIPTMPDESLLDDTIQSIEPIEAQIYDSPYNEDIGLDNHDSNLEQGDPASFDAPADSTAFIPQHQSPLTPRPETFRDTGDADANAAASGNSQTSKRRTRTKTKTNPPPKERDPNVTRSRVQKASEKFSRTSRAGSVGPRTYTVARSETPATDGGAFKTRSGRTSIKPLATWRGEKAIYSQRTSRDSLPGLQQVVRTDEVLASPRRRTVSIKTANTRRKAQSQTIEVIYEEDNDDGDGSNNKARGKTPVFGEPEDVDMLEPWETEIGIQHATVTIWDDQTAAPDEDKTEELEVAYAANAIEMRPVKTSSFRFAKTLTMPFFGAGMLHLPPGAEKRTKNSRKMQMAFFIHTGRVSVHIGSPPTSFSIGVGGVWHVPRGNFYSITNESDTVDAKLFFAQGCQWAGDTGEISTAND